MIKFLNSSKEAPYKKFRELYKIALENGQNEIQAVCISSFSKKYKEVNSRFVNLKFIDNKEFIFFSNYESQKASEFEEHSQIAALFFWDKPNIQIRLKAKISKTSVEFNNNYFQERSKEKNALAISSKQSQIVEDYNMVRKNFNLALENENLKICPDHWGGFTFMPSYFEFWEGNKYRINKREVFKKNKSVWNSYYLEP